MRVIALLAALTACASHAPAAPSTPSDAPIAVSPPSPTTKLYADCIADAAAHDHYGHASDGDTNIIVFTCAGAPAQAFFDALASYDGKMVFQRDGREVRTTQRVQHDLFGVDYCSTDRTTYECVITLNAGRFVRD